MYEHFHTHVKLSIRSRGKGFFGPGIADLLERIDETGSIKDACARMEMSYSKGRSILKRAEEALGFPLLTIRRGGSGGGAACLTEGGKAFLGSYRELERNIGAYAEAAFRETFAEEIDHRRTTVL